MPNVSVASWGFLAIGGMIGCWARFLIGTLIAGRSLTLGAHPVWAGPIGTFCINMVGSLVIGLVAALALNRPTLMTPEVRLLLAVGFCGSFTTFSSYALEALLMGQTGRWGEALLYALASNTLGLACVALGWWLGSRGA